MTATEQWIFLCAAHKTPKEVFSNTFNAKIYCLLLLVFNCFHSVQQLTTQDTHLMELHVSSIATNTFPAGECPPPLPLIRFLRHGCCPHLSFKFFLLNFRVSIKETSVAKLGSVCRRVYRIFSHAYFHHRTLFDEYEVQSHYSFLFRLLCIISVASFHRTRLLCVDASQPSS